MPIDGADHVDDPVTPRPPDNSRTSDDPRPPDTADRAAAHCVYRAQVDRHYAAEATWAEAVPKLRLAWAEHQVTYPERVRAVPQTHPDDSWSSGERRLAPDQNAEATEACADIHEEGERVILPAMSRIEEADPDRRLAGLKHMLKGADRLKEKVAERLRYHPDWAPRQAVAEVPDAVRFTLQYRESRYTPGVLADVERLKEAGYELLRLKNLWANEQYKGVNSQWRRPETGLCFEIQFHTQESREAKQLTHEAYERLRDPLTSKAEEIKYYAIVDDSTRGDELTGVLRQFSDGDRRDESFGRDLEWRFSSLRHSVEHGDTEYDLIPITEGEAEQIVARIRGAAEPGE